jgi:hypothetical protein
MANLRHILHRRWAMAFALIAMAMLARMAVPGGFMPVVENGHVVITLCSGHGPMQLTGNGLTPPMPGMTAAKAAGPHHEHHDRQSDNKDSICPFAGLSLPSLTAADPLLLAVAILFIVTTIFRLPERIAVAAPRALWPPITGPPAIA